MLPFLSRFLGRAEPVAAVPHCAHVGVYLRGAQLIVAGDDETEAGFWIATDRVAVLPATAPADAVGEAVRAALTASRLGVPTPRFGIGAPPLDAPLWRAAGVRSRRAFMTGTRLCFVALNEAGIAITATRNGGSQGEQRGWSPGDTPPRALAADASAELLGAAVLAALAEGT